MTSPDKSNVMINLNSDESLRAGEDTKRREAEQSAESRLCRVTNNFCFSSSRFGKIVILFEDNQCLLPAWLY